MGNTNTTVTSGVKEQAAGGTEVSRKLYKFINLTGSGELVDLMKKANRTKDYTELDHRIREGLRPFLYNGGNGRLVHIRELVQARCLGNGMNLGKKMGSATELSHQMDMLHPVVDKYDSLGKIGRQQINVKEIKYNQFCRGFIVKAPTEAPT